MDGLYWTEPDPVSCVGRGPAPHAEHPPFKIEPPISQNATFFGFPLEQTDEHERSELRQSGRPVRPTPTTRTGRRRPAPRLTIRPNYVGWTTQNVKWLRSSDPQHGVPEPRRGGQPHPLPEPFQGVRLAGLPARRRPGPDLRLAQGRDHVLSNQRPHQRPQWLHRPGFPGRLSTSPHRCAPARRSHGAASTYIPKSLTDRLPWGTTVSLFYNRSQNFKADASRLDLAGNQIPNATGHTKEYGITITTLNDKLTLKVNRYKTRVANATLADTQGNSIAGLGNNAYFIADGAIWGYSWATGVQEGLAGNTPNNNFWDAANADGVCTRNAPAQIAAYRRTTTAPAAPSWTATAARTSYVGGNAIVQAWICMLQFLAKFFSRLLADPRNRSDPGLQVRPVARRLCRRHPRRHRRRCTGGRRFKLR